MHMLAISHSQTRLLLLEIDKSLLGKLKVKSGGKENLTEDTKWQETVEKIAKNKHLAFAISNTHIFRFSVSKDIKNDALENTIIHKVKETTALEHFAYDYLLLNANENSQHVLIACLSAETLSLYHDIAKKADAKSLTIIPHSLAVFEILRHQIEKGETILYVDSEAHGSTFTFFDYHGPVTQIKEFVYHDKLADEIKKTVELFTKEQNKNISTIILGGEKNESINRNTIQDAIGIETVFADTIFNDAVLDLRISFDSENPYPFLNALGLGILSFQKESLNLAKKENLEKLSNTFKSQDQQEQYPLHTKSSIFPKFSKKSIFILAILLAAIPSLLFVYSNFNSVKETQKVPAAQKIEPTLAPTPVLQKSDLVIAVENGSGKAGLAAKASEAFKKIGYTNIEAKNADAFTYKDITVKIKESKKAYRQQLVKDLKDQFNANAKQEELDEKNNFDAIIIFGSY